MIKFVGVTILGYLLGSIPWGVLAGKIRGTEVTKRGSGKTGMTNVIRLAGVRTGILVFIGDLAKAVVAVLLARLILGTPASEVAAGAAAIVGHDWPIYTRFRGGRGATTAAGALFGMSLPLPWLGIFSLVVFSATVAASRYASLGSLLGTLLTFIAMIPLAFLNQMPDTYLIYGAIATFLVFFQHRDNIKRLMSGTERKVGTK